MDIKDIIGVIFDFNGTMFFDSKKHIEAWASYVYDMTGIEVTHDEKEKYIVNKSGKEIMEHFLGYEVSDEMMDQFSEEKEGIYRKLCREDEENLRLAPGLEKFLDFLDEHDVPRTIATTASLSNVMFYFETFDLYRWFDPEKLVCHENGMRDKPFPDMYLAACKMLNKNPNRCLVFEDSAVGITAAEKAGVKNVVAVVGDNRGLMTEGFKSVKAVIKDYFELNKTLEV